MHGTVRDRAASAAGRRWQLALTGLVAALLALLLIGCGAERTDDEPVPTGRDGEATDRNPPDDEPSEDEVELPDTGTDEARRLVEERSGLELPGDAAVEVRSLVADTDEVVARFDMPLDGARELCDQLGGWGVLRELSAEQRDRFALTGDPGFIRLCRASDPASPSRQRDVLLVADADEPEVVTVHLYSWVMPAR